jgi:hypothetical protein
LNLLNFSPNKDPYSNWVVDKKGITKKIFGFKGGYPAKFAKFSMWKLTMHR